MHGHVIWTVKGVPRVPTALDTRHRQRSLRSKRPPGNLRLQCLFQLTGTCGGGGNDRALPPPGPVFVAIPSTQATLDRSTGTLGVATDWAIAPDTFASIRIYVQTTSQLLGEKASESGEGAGLRNAVYRRYWNRTPGVGATH